MGTFTTLPQDKTGYVEGVTYIYEHSITGNSYPMSIKVDLYIDGSLYDTLYLNGFFLTVNGGTYTYSFEINLKDRLSSYFDNQQVFPVNVSSYPTHNGFDCEVVLEVYDWLPNSNGLLSESITPVTAPNRRFFNSWQKDWTPNFALLGRSFLTNEPYPKCIIGQDKPLGIYADNHLTHLRVNVDGDVSLIPLTKDKVNVINLKAFLVEGSQSIHIQGGTVEGETFTANSLAYNPQVINPCQALILQFLNRFGVVDTLIFEEFNITTATELEYYSNEYQKHLINRIELEEAFAMTKDRLFKIEVEWIKELLRSNVYFIQQGTETKQAVLEEVNMPLQTLDNSYELSLSGKYSAYLPVFSS